MWSRPSSRAVAAAFAVAIVAAGAVGTVAADGGVAAGSEADEDCGTDCRVGAVRTTAGSAPNGSGSPTVAHFSQGTLGETVRIPVTLGNASVATVTVGGPTFNYVVNGTVRDGNGDGRVVVLFDTGAAGRELPTLGVANASDDLTPAGEETTLDDPLDPAEYDVSVARGTGPSAAPVDVGTLVVHDSAWAPTSVPADGRAPGGIGVPAGGLTAGIPADAAGALAIGAGLALLSLRALFVSRRP